MKQFLYYIFSLIQFYYININRNMTDRTSKGYSSSTAKKQKNYNSKILRLSQSSNMFPQTQPITHITIANQSNAKNKWSNIINDVEFLKRRLRQIFQSNSNKQNQRKSINKKKVKKNDDQNRSCGMKLKTESIKDNNNSQHRVESTYILQKDIEKLRKQIRFLNEQVIYLRDQLVFEHQQNKKLRNNIQIIIKQNENLRNQLSQKTQITNIHHLSDSEQFEQKYFRGLYQSQLLNSQKNLKKINESSKISQKLKLSILQKENSELKKQCQHLCNEFKECIELIKPKLQKSVLTKKKLNTSYQVQKVFDHLLEKQKNIHEQKIREKLNEINQHLISLQNYHHYKNILL